MLTPSHDRTIRPQGPSTRPREDRTSRDLLRGLHVILVEDHADTCQTYAEGLRQMGADVTTASTAQMALLALQQRRPDVLVVDIGLPDVDGNQLLKNVRALRPGEGWDAPAIALTAYNSLQDRLKTVDAGFRLHVAKPIDPADLGTLVAELARARG